MIKILLISDTHGHLDAINDLVEKTQVDLVIHAGDFGFYNESSYKHLSTRELRLLISHSSYWKNYRVDKQTDRETLIEIVKRHQLLGNFSDYQDNIKKFKVPVYAVYGNHEDSYVIKQLKENNPIHNFNLLDEDNIFQITKKDEILFKLFGVGGNFLVSNKLLDRPIAGRAGKLWVTLHQFGVLYKNLDKKSKPSLFVSHVSPGKEPLLVRLMIHFMPDMWISGHMGAPYTCVWNEFTIRDMDESLDVLNSAVEQLSGLDVERMTPEAKLAYDVIKREIPRKDFWFKKLWYVNLPDAKDGYAILNYHNEKFFVEGRCNIN